MKSKTAITTSSDTSNLLYLLLMFFIAQFLYYLANAGFHSTFGGVDPFVADLSFLQTHYWQSLFYYHLAPPLYIFYVSVFNLFLPPDGELGFYFLHTMLGIYAIFSLYKIQRRLGVNSVLATFLTTAFVLSPSFNLQQTMASYDFPTACLILISTWRFAKLLDNPRFSTAFTFFSIVALLCSIRSLYHVVLYMLPVILMTLIALKKQWKMILIASLIPFLFVFSAYFKNYILYNVFTTSSYFGETLDTAVMQFNVTLPQREEGIEKGFFSKLALCPSSADTIATRTANSKFSGWDCYDKIAEPYRQAYIQQLGKDYSNIPLLSCEPLIGVPGHLLPRRSCLGNIGMSMEYQKNAVQAIRHYPGSYWSGIKAAWASYFTGTVTYFFNIMQNTRHLSSSLSHSWVQVFKPRYSVPLLLAYPLLILFSICYLLYSRKGILFSLALYVLAFIPTLYHYIQFKRLNPDQVQQGIVVWMLAMFIFVTLALVLLRALLSLIHNHFIHRLIVPIIDYKERIIMLFILGNILFTTMIITLLVGFGQQRYRFYIDGLYLILLALFIQTIILPFVRKLTLFRPLT